MRKDNPLLTWETEVIAHNLPQPVGYPTAPGFYLPKLSTNGMLRPEPKQEHSFPGQPTVAQQHRLCPRALYQLHLWQYYSCMERRRPSIQYQLCLVRICRGQRHCKMLSHSSRAWVVESSQARRVPQRDPVHPCQAQHVCVVYLMQHMAAEMSVLM